MLEIMYVSTLKARLMKIRRLDPKYIALVIMHYLRNQSERQHMMPLTGLNPFENKKQREKVRLLAQPSRSNNQSVGENFASSSQTSEDASFIFEWEKEGVQVQEAGKRS